jgi:hypothetical protein
MPNKASEPRLQKRFGYWTAIGAIVLGVLALAIPLTKLLAPEPEFRLSVTSTVEAQIERLATRVESLEVRTKAIQSDLNAFSQAIAKVAENPDAMKAVGTDALLQKTSKDIEAIQSALGPDLERTLSIPLLRKDLEEIQARLNERAASTSTEIDRIYDQNKWFLGLMATMAIAVIGLAVSNVLQSRGEKEVRGSD